MKYNVLESVEWYINTETGNVDPDIPGVYSLLSYTDTPVVSISGTDVFAIDFDFGYRIHLDRIEYKCSTTAPTSDIEFSYKNEDFDDYVSLATYYDDQTEVFYSTLSGTVFAPRYIKFVHTPSVPTTIYGFKAFNDDTLVGFGEDGSATGRSLEVIREEAAVITPIAVYNNGSRTADAYVNMEPSYTGMDEAIGLSASPSGPWIYAFGDSDTVVGWDTFNLGSFSAVSNVGDVLQVTGANTYDGYYISYYTTGTYTTPVFKRKDYDYTRYVINRTIDTDGSLRVDIKDPVETIEVRSSNTIPKPYLTMIEFYSSNDGYYYYYSYKDTWIPSGSSKSNSSTLMFPAFRYSRYVEHIITMDQKTENYGGCVMTYYPYDSRSDTILYLFKNNLRSNTSQYYELTRTSSYTTKINYNWFETLLDYSGGMWVFFFCQAYDSGKFVDNKGYYLCYFDSTLTNSFKYMTTATDGIGKVINDYNDKSVWYTAPGNCAIYNLSTDGTVVINFSDEDYADNLGGIAVFDDGNLLFANHKDLHILHKTGYPISASTISDAAGEKFGHIRLDPVDVNAIWVIDGSSTVGRFFIGGDRKGEWDFKVTMNLPMDFDVVDSGIWVRCAGEEGVAGVIMRYVSKENRKVDYEHIADDRCKPGIHYQDYTYQYYIEKMPLASDSIWPNLDWRKVNLDNYLLSEDRYHQIRLTLRNQEPIKRYPELVEDPYMTWPTEFYFDQDSIKPNELYWSTWRNYPNTDRVYVDTATNYLVLKADKTSDYDAYIRSTHRWGVTRGSSSTFEIRVAYKFGTGDGMVTTTNQQMYIEAYSVSEAHSGHRLSAILRINPSPDMDDSAIWVAWNGGTWQGANFTASSSFYEGEFALYWNGSTVSASVRKDTSSSWSTYSYSNITSATVGTHFYVNIYGSRAYDDLQIKYVKITSGSVFTYTETPYVSSIGTQPLVKLGDVPPKTSKNVYTRTYIPRDLEVDPETELDMKVRWRMPVY